MLINPAIKRGLVIIILLLIAVFGAKQLHHYLTTGAVSVHTDSKNGYIKIVGLDGSSSSRQNPEEKGDKLSARLKPGQYIVQAYTPSMYTNDIITLKARQKISLNLQLDATRNPEPVVNNTASSIAAGSNVLYFIDSQSGNLTKIDDQGNVTVADSSQVFKKVRWANPNLGLAMDDSYNLYTIQNGVVGALALPFSTSNNPSVDFDIASNGNIYISNGQDVFSGNVSGNFMKIYSSGNNYNSTLAATGSAVAFIEKNASDGSGSVVVLRGGGQKKISSDASQLAWSPDGNYLVASGDKSGVIYNNNLEARSVLPNQGITHPMWTGEKSLVYTVGNVVWQYDLASKESKAVATLSADQSISAMTISDGQAYLYFSGRDQILRIGLQGQPANNLVALGAFLPETVGVCYLNYVNFTRPTITISYPALETSDDLCIGAAKKELQYYGVDPSKFSYSVTSQPSQGE